MAKLSASAPSAATQASVRPALVVMIMGFSAVAMIAAASSRAAGDGWLPAGAARLYGDAYSKRSIPSASTSRGKVR